MLEASQFAAALAIGAVLAPRLVEDVDIVIAAIEEVEVDRVEARRRGDVARLSGRSGGTEEDSGTRRRRPRKPVHFHNGRLARGRVFAPVRAGSLPPLAEHFDCFI